MTTPPFIDLDHAQSAAAGRARTTMQTWHVIDTPRGYQLADDTDIACWKDQPIFTIEPELSFSAAEMDDLPGIENEPEEPPVYPAPNGRAPFCATCGDDGDCPDCEPVRIRIPRGTEIVHQASGRTRDIPSALIVTATRDPQSGCMLFHLPSYGRCYVAEGWALNKTRCTA